MNWKLAVSICRAFLIVSMGVHSLIDIYPRLDKSKVNSIAAKINGTIKSACWITLDLFHRKTMIEERGICRKICEKSAKQLKILRVIFCKKKAAAKVKFDFLISNCSQILRQHQLCHIQNISYESLSDVFPVQLKLHRCRKRHIM
uniref:Saposin B-type domain-containing protein n=1 Tax=Elaeophora elaphi TaxID=1147741 RepID=A0A0R3RQZ2_9BILA